MNGKLIEVNLYEREENLREKSANYYEIELKQRIQVNHIKFWRRITEPTARRHRLWASMVSVIQRKCDPYV